MKRLLVSSVSRATVLIVLFLTISCGDYKRDNPVDPEVSGGLSLRDQLIGSWSREQVERNELYVFKIDGRVELRDFSSSDGGDADRNAPFPTTRVRVFEGTFRLVGNLLTIFFTQAQSNDPDDTIVVPGTEKIVDISIRRGTLIFQESDGKRFYTRD